MNYCHVYTTQYENSAFSIKKKTQPKTLISLQTHEQNSALRSQDATSW
ncbi:Uncharacterized protein APZ42_023195 [Daphnia magna]|uniref:Uncharacterized protein n=1 Tax=Daphnia magna TaxID=35525 RepID=A0A164V594_9CRUS|nr:Uncharacterized protein APZ42_023195 [Daphnia magna]